MSTADKNASQFKKCSCANIYLRGTSLIMIISKNFSQKMHCVYKYITFPYQKLQFNEKQQTCPETKGGSIKHNNCKGQYYLLIRVYRSNIQLNGLHSLSHVVFLPTLWTPYYYPYFMRDKNKSREVKQYIEGHPTTQWHKSGLKPSESLLANPCMCKN